MYKICADLTSKHPGCSTHLLITPRKEGGYSAQHKGGKLYTSNMLTEESRLYVVGHGNISCFKVSGDDGKALAQMIAKLLHHFNIKSIKRIGAVACFSTMWGIKHVNTLGPQVKLNFAQQLHYHLGETHKIYTQVSAYGACVATDSGTGRKKTGFLDQNDVPQWGAPDPRTGKYDNTENKLYYYWKDIGQQRVGRSVSEEDHIVDILG